MSAVADYLGTRSPDELRQLATHLTRHEASHGTLATLAWACHRDIDTITRQRDQEDNETTDARRPAQPNSASSDRGGGGRDGAPRAPHSPQPRRRDGDYERMGFEP